MEKRKPKVRRTDWNRKPRFNRRASKIKWRKAKGRDSKIRLARKGHTPSPGIGFRMPKVTRGLVNGMKPMLISNLADLDKLDKKDLAIVSGNLGRKKKIELAHKALKAKIKFLNFDPQKLLNEVEKQKEDKKKDKEKAKKEEKKTETKKEETEKPKEKEK